MSKINSQSLQVYSNQNSKSAIYPNQKSKKCTKIFGNFFFSKNKKTIYFLESFHIFLLYINEWNFRSKLYDEDFTSCYKFKIRDEANES